MDPGNITRKKIFLDIVTTLYTKKEYAPMMYITKKKWEEGDLGTTMTSGWALQAAFITFRVASKVWKISSLTWSLFIPNYLFIGVSKLIPKSQQTMGRMELKIKSSRRNVRIRFRRFVRFNFFPFPFEQLYRLVTPMETGHSIEFRDMETISFWLLYNSTSTCDMLYSCPWNTMLFSRSHILHIFLRYQDIFEVPGEKGDRKCC